MLTARQILDHNDSGEPWPAGGGDFGGLASAYEAALAAARLGAGDVVTTGTWTDAWPVKAGERWATRYDSVLPALEVEFR